MKLVHRYVFINVLKSFFAVIAVLMGVAMIVEWMKVGGLISVHDIDLLFLSMVPVGMFAIPMGVVFSVLLVMERLSSDSEIIAMKASGITSYGIYTPVIIFSMLCMILHLAISTYLGPISIAKMQKRIVNEASQKIYAFIEERDFQRVFKGLILYVDAVDRISHQLKGVFIQTAGEHPSIITADRGSIDFRASMIVLNLEDGSIYLKQKQAIRYATFKEYTFSIDANLSNELNIRTYDTATQPQLKQMIKKNPDPRLIKEYHTRLSFPVLDLILGMIGVSFGIHRYTRSGRQTGFLVGIGTIVAYYMVYVLSSRLVKGGLLGPVTGAWFPDIIFVLALFVLWLWQRNR